jgi:cation diffusion facilitator CzcD-associated flavoprotein CzcO
VDNDDDVRAHDEPRVAIVGGGLAGFTAYLTLRHAGVRDVAVLADERDPAGPFARRAGAIRQRAMRSESDGNCFPRSFPGLAAREALRRRSAGPLLGTLTNRYRPTVDWFLRHVRELREVSGWDEAVVEARVERVRAVDGGFELDGRGPFHDVLLAPGHPGPAIPADLEGDPRVVHAYEPHDYGRDVAVVGAGMAAATEWLNALAAGAAVTSVRRRDPLRRPLNVPRPLFSKRGLAAFHATSRTQRAALLTELSAPSYPTGAAWDDPVEQAARDGRFCVREHVDGADQVICATGFRQGFRHNSMLGALVDDHGLETVDRWIVLDERSCVPGLTGASRTLALAGAPAQWAYPAADTLVGMKWAARRFARRVTCRTR